jgi:hypothetical protein
VSAKPACQLLQRSILPKCLADSRSRGPVKSCPHRCVLRESDSPLLAPACLESRNQPLPDLDVFLGRPAPMATAGNVVAQRHSARAGGTPASGALRPLLSERATALGVTARSPDADFRPAQRVSAAACQGREPRCLQRVPREADDGIRTHDLLHGKEAAQGASRRQHPTNPLPDVAGGSAAMPPEGQQPTPEPD